MLSYEEVHVHNMYLFHFQLNYCYLKKLDMSIIEVSDSINISLNFNISNFLKFKTYHKTSSTDKPTAL